MSDRQGRVWMELILPLYALALVIVYYRPQALLPAIEGMLTVGILKWALWAIAVALGGLLALSALVLAFFLLYSPLYLANNSKRILDPQTWVDQREVRFYLGCFVVLCALLTLGVFQPNAALASFTLLAGCASFLWRLLV